MPLAPSFCCEIITLILDECRCTPLESPRGRTPSMPTSYTESPRGGASSTSVLTGGIEPSRGGGRLQHLQFGRALLRHLLQAMPPLEWWPHLVYSSSYTNIIIYIDIVHAPMRRSHAPAFTYVPLLSPYFLSHIVWSLLFVYNYCVLDKRHHISSKVDVLALWHAVLEVKSNKLSFYSFLSMSLH
jgi:hypothetical protein